MRHLTLFTTLFALLSSAASAATAEDVLAKLDAAAPAFKGMSADLNRLAYTKVLDEKTTESGTISLRKQGRNLQVLIELTKPDPKVVAFSGRKAEVYYPKMKTVQEWDLGKHSDLVDQFLLVGFGTGRDLKASYGVKYGGEETIGGVKTHKLELTPLTAKTKEQLRRVDLWIADNGAFPVQQRFVQPSGDYYLATYTNVKLNPALSDEALKLKLPQGIKREYPQK